MKPGSFLSAAAAALAIGAQTCEAAPIAFESSMLDLIDKILHLEATLTSTQVSETATTTALVTPTIKPGEYPFRDGPVIYPTSTPTP
ncbi:unnamed protein product [Clonostachys rosea f. rosea IK726]|jgi:hypothetical protein|uniref:Uncharacterized protein n=3 Tax=Clonostachys TaxID=110564 RepID=A0A8H7K1B1_BIOOC|nr:unnamed protein product [Clonostachys rosea f. rosea IK726]CAH0043111.1 unnamed protein product [Clonostachys rhizophaga]